MKNKYIYAVIVLMQLTFLLACTDDSIKDNNQNRQIIITATMPGGDEVFDATSDGPRKVSLSQKDGSLDLIARCKEGDVIHLFVRQNNTFYTIEDSQVSDISNDGKTCSFKIQLPSEVDPGCLYEIFGLCDVEGYIVEDAIDFVVAKSDLRRVVWKNDNDAFAPIWFHYPGGDDAGIHVNFKHLGTYEVLHIKNTSSSPISFQHWGFDVQNPWYKCEDRTMLDENYDPTKYFVEPGDEISEKTTIAAGATGRILSWYLPSGAEMKEARLQANINGKAVTSTNTKSSAVKIQRGHVYHMYATWDGNELKFEDGDIDDGHNSADAEDLVINGNFNLGNVGFTSDYEYVSETGSSMMPENRYTVGTSPRNYHSGFIIHGDHTTGDGNMLIANGSVDNSKFVWKQTVFVEKGKTYEFSAWFLSVSENTPLNKDMIEYVINEEANLGEYDKTENDWQRYYWRYTATESGFIDIKIRSLSSAASGNDFAIDDISFTSNISDQECYLSCPDDNHPHIIHMGIAGKWACCNVGASAPWEYGGYYAWGETEEKECYDWNTYIYCDGSSETCHDLGDNISGSKYDVAHVKWGGKWCMPSEDQFDLLDEYCAKQHTEVNGIRGYKYTSATGGSIFIPDAGIRKNDEVLYAGQQGFCWLSSRYWDDENNQARYAYGHSTAGGGISTGSRCDGIPVRPVIANQDSEISCPDDKHPHVIDMGIAGKWACCNVGAYAPWEIGNHYSWGNTTETDCSIYDINIDITGSKYDIAHVEWGGNWCMPSFDQLKLLKKSCINMQKTINGINGVMFTAPNGCSIFLPAAGCRWDNQVHYIGDRGYYWSTTIRETDGAAFYMEIYGSGKHTTFYGTYRGYEYSVRPIYYIY